MRERERLAAGQQLVHVEFAPLRDDVRVAAEMEAGADRGDRDPAVIERDRMKDVTVRSVAEDGVELAAIRVVLERDGLRDREQVLAERPAGALRDIEQAEKVRG